MGGRALLGFGNSLAQICSPMLLTEIAHPQHRARLTTIYNCLWNVGALSKFLYSGPGRGPTGHVKLTQYSRRVDFLRHQLPLQ
jgi:hypothetical protein